MAQLNKDTVVCISLSGHPSNIGTRFHNFLYDELDLDFLYKSLSTDDIEGAIRGVRALGFRGCSVSMPFKEAVLDFVDRVEPSAATIGAVNTIVNDDGRLTASNTDVEAIIALLADHGVDPAGSVLLRGSGGMAKAVVAAFREVGFGDLTVVARNTQAGPALAEQYGYRWVPVDPDPGAAVIVNVTPFGMDGPQSGTLAFSPGHIAAAETVVDVVAFPSETPLIRAARDAGASVITGAEVIALQAARQFEKYTGVALTAEQVARASKYSRRG